MQMSELASEQRVTAGANKSNIEHHKHVNSVCMVPRVRMHLKE